MDKPVSEIEMRELIDELCDQILSSAKPELERLWGLALRYQGQDDAQHRYYTERHAWLHRRTIDAIASARAPIVNLAMMRLPMPIIADGIDAALGDTNAA